MSDTGPGATLRAAMATAGKAINDELWIVMNQLYVIGRVTEVTDQHLDVIRQAAIRCALASSALQAASRAESDPEPLFYA